MSCFALALVALAAALGAGASVARADDDPALVSLPSVSNGCGGGVASDEPRFADEWAFGAWRVNFREACNVHDAAYSGAVVFDPFSRKVIDFRNWTRKQIDDKFLEDMRTLCRRQITGAARGSSLESARNDCTHGEGRFEPSCNTFYNAIPQIGGNSTIGALFAYKLVRRCGDAFFRQRADLSGSWVNRDSKGTAVRSATIRQVGRTVTVSWTGEPKFCGTGTGTLVTRDQNDEIVGDARITGFTNGDVYEGGFRVVSNKDGSITFRVPGTPTLRRAARSTKAVEAVCTRPTAKPKPPATSGATFTLTNTKVTNPSAPEVTVDATGGKIIWNHTGQYGGAGKGGEWKVDCTFQVPKTITAGASYSIMLGLVVSEVMPVQPLLMEMGARAPDFVGRVSVNYPNPASASKTFSVPLSASYKDFKDVFVVVGFGSAEITFTYHRAGS